MYCSGACLTSKHKTKKEKYGNGAKERRGREGKGGERKERRVEEEGEWGGEGRGGEWV